MKTKHLDYDYLVCEKELIIMSLDVEPSNRRKGIATSFLKEFELLAKNKECKNITVPASLSKIALSFWLKNGYMLIDSDAKRKVKRVLNSKKNATFILELEENSVVPLYKEIQC